MYRRHAIKLGPYSIVVHNGEVRNTNSIDGITNTDGRVLQIFG